MSLMDDLNRAARSVMDFFFPRQCPFCGGIVGRELLCDKCRKTLPYTGEHAVVDGRFGSAAAPLYYEGAVREAVHRLKFKGKLGGLDCFGQLMAETAAEHFSGAFDTITWVPVSRERLRKRGYDQARLLAASVCVDWHVATPPSPAFRMRPSAARTSSACTRPCIRRRSAVSASCSSTTCSQPARRSPSAPASCARRVRQTCCA